MGTIPGINFVVQPERRICTVGHKSPRTGYFHCWEHFSKPVSSGLDNWFPSRGDYQLCGRDR